MRNNKGRGETQRGRVEREEEFLSRGRKGLRGVSSTSEPLSHPFRPTLFLRHLRLLGRFCSLRARRRAVCSSSPSVCRPPSVEDHVYNRVAVDLRRLPTLRAPSAASPPRIKRENTSLLLRFHSNFLPSFLRFLNECHSTCRVLFLFLRGVQRPRIFEEEEEREIWEKRAKLEGKSVEEEDGKVTIRRIFLRRGSISRRPLTRLQAWTRSSRAVPKVSPFDLCLDRATITIPIGDTYIPATTCGISTSPPRCSLDQVALDQPPGAFEGGGRVRPVDFAGIVVAACWRQWRAARRAKVR